jgi:hypothetical protein
MANCPEKTFSKSRRRNLKKVENTKAFYYFDEAGDPQILGRKGVNLIEKGVASKTFMVGYLEIKEPKKLREDLEKLRAEIVNDEYFSEIPSISSTKMMFHANKDCSEVREKVFKLLKNTDFSFYCIVARKKEDLFRKKFNLKSSEIYSYLVSKLLENRLHLYTNIDCYFSSMGNVVRQKTMQDAIQKAILTFETKWHTKNQNNIRVIIQKSSEEPLLQASDYVLWTIQRAYEKGEFRYYNYLKDKICLIHDVFDFEKYPKNYYSPKNPLEAKKIDPV